MPILNKTVTKEQVTKLRILKSYVIYKAKKALDIEELIDKYLSDVAKINKKETEAFVDDIYIYVMQRVKEIDKKQLIALVDTKLTHLSYSVDSTTLEEIYNKSAITVATGIKASFEFDKKDAQVIESVNRSLLWMKDDGTKNTQDKVKKVITSAMSGDIPTSEIGATLRKELSGIVDESSRYFTNVSDHIIRQSQSLNRVYQYEKAGIEYVKAVAKIDKKTSKICLSMNGRIIPIKHLTTQANAVTSATDIEAKKKASQWQSTPLWGKLPANVGMSPYHFGCRTIMVAHFPENETIDGESVDGSLVSGDTHNQQKVEYSLRIPKYDKEAIITKKTAKNGVSDADIIKGLKEVDRIELSILNPVQNVAYSTKTKKLYTLEDNIIVSVKDADKKAFDSLTKEK